MTDTLPSGYETQTFEARLYAQWEASGCFKPRGQGVPYSILLPPPNVTGTLHMGHAFQHTLMDALVRYRRMRGFDVLWQMGTDHAGIATEMVVSRNLAPDPYTHLRAHETEADLVCRLLLEKKKTTSYFAFLLPKP